MAGLDAREAARGAGLPGGACLLHLVIAYCPDPESRRVVAFSPETPMPDRERAPAGAVTSWRLGASFRWFRVPGRGPGSGRGGSGARGAQEPRGALGQREVAGVTPEGVRI